MKNKIVTIIALMLAGVLMPEISFSQARIGYHVSDIQREFEDQNPKVEHYDSGSKALVIETKNKAMMYMLNNDSICYAFALFVYDDKLFKDYIMYYNKKYVIISDTKWKQYLANGIINIELSFTEQGTPVFYFFN